MKSTIKIRARFNIDKLDLLSKIALISAPVVFIHSVDDKLIPFRHS
jgi:fermentation-respiration switch protein FrsA (DUF1100 family)